MRKATGALTARSKAKAAAKPPEIRRQPTATLKTGRRYMGLRPALPERRIF